MRHTSRRPVTLLFTSLALIAAACGSDSADSADAGCFADPGMEPVVATEDADDPVTVRLATHDSFAISDGIIESFTADTGIAVERVEAGDAGSLVSSAILTKDNPTADVIFGIDNTFLCRGLEADLFAPYVSPLLDDVADELELDPFHRVTPIDYGDVCANYWIDALPGDAPQNLDDLLDETNAGQFVTQNPETSSPGFAFLLATIARYGEDGWEQYWEQLVANDVAVTADWESAYYGEFTAGGGERSIVMSYASSPAAEVLFADPPVEVAPTGVLQDSCYRQIEFAGVVAGSPNAGAAAKLIDFMLSPTFQEDIPLNMFVYPVNDNAVLPPAFTEHAQLAPEALSLDPALIEANRDAWTERFTTIVLR